jgi:S1-C subfamily serine protease
MDHDETTPQEHEFAGWFRNPGELPPAPPPPTTEVREPRRRGRGALSGLLAALLLLGAGAGVGYGLRGGRPATSILPKTSSGQADQGTNAQAIASSVTPAVVDINTVIESPIGGIFGGPSRAEAAGTGMIISPNGEVLTNNHVIEGATAIRVSIAGRSGSYTAHVLGVDPKDDVALLKIEGVRGLPTVAFGDSSSLSVGQEVVAIGNALGQGGDPTVTEGTISALRRSISVGDGRGGEEHLRTLIQTDASISPGDSGGPLVNASGQVVGIITASARNMFDQSGSNVGFAIPVNRAVRIVGQIRGGHESPSIVIGAPGFLGVQVRDVDAATARNLGIPRSGALIVAVVPGDPADQAGLTAGSVVTSVNGTRVTSSTTLGPALHVHKPGERVTVGWVDPNGTKHTTEIRLTTGPAV